jgi:hypothetical protein
MFTVSNTATNGYSYTTLSGSGLGGGEVDFGNQTIRHAAIASLSGSALAFYTNNTNSGAAVSERMRIDSSGNLLFNSGYGSVATAYGCRAWVNFNGTGTVSIRGSANVSSITDNGTGDYTVNFTTAMSDANYSVVASSSYSANAARGSVWAEPYAVSTSAARILTSGTAALFDVASVTAAIFR